MRILWISPNGGKFDCNPLKGTGGWIGALQECLMEYSPDIDLGMVFPSTHYANKKIGNVSYYPIHMLGSNLFQKVKDRIFVSESNKEKKLIQGILNAIDDFKPDLVHVWGVENTYAAVIPYIKVPFVVHIQGLISLCFNNYLPSGVSYHDLKRNDTFLNPKNIIKKILHMCAYDAYRRDKYRAEREKKVSKYVKNWIGRTNWDYQGSKILSPQSRYFHCDELLREEFFNNRWHYHFENELVIHSSISANWYKGIDVVLKTAKVLHDIGIKIRWNVYGLNEDSNVAHFFIKELKIKPSKVGVIFHGLVEGQVIRNSLLSSDVFVHPSYMENSSNAIAEAMSLGVPTIAQYIGGNPSILRDNSGVLVPANDPVILAYQIMEMREENKAVVYSRKALEISMQRHKKLKVLSDLIGVYKEVVNS